MNVRRATIADLNALVPLFDAYRMFYNQASDADQARFFLSQRFELADSVILITEESEECVGFAQLFPTFSSTRMARTFLLGDLFVKPAARGKGVGKALLNAAVEIGAQVNAARLFLFTAADNHAAQSLYEGAGWARDPQFIAYFRPLN